VLSSSGLSAASAAPGPTDEPAPAGCLRCQRRGCAGPNSSIAHPHHATTTPRAWLRSLCSQRARIGVITMAHSGEEIIMPRNFVLLEELEKAEKGNTDMSISYGLVHADDITLSTWQCTILGPSNSPVENRIISLLITVGPNYPQVKPEVQFQTKLNYPWLSVDGKLVESKCEGTLKAWNKTHRLESVLVQLRLMIANRQYSKLAQPPEGATYP